MYLCNYGSQVLKSILKELAHDGKYYFCFRSHNKCCHLWVVTVLCSWIFSVHFVLSCFFVSSCLSMVIYSEVLEFLSVVSFHHLCSFCHWICYCKLLKTYSLSSHLFFPFKFKSSLDMAHKVNQKL